MSLKESSLPSKRRSVLRRVSAVLIHLFNTTTTSSANRTSSMSHLQKDDDVTPTAKTGSKRSMFSSMSTLSNTASRQSVLTADDIEHEIDEMFVHSRQLRMEAQCALGFITEDEFIFRTNSDFDGALVLLPQEDE